MEYRIVSNFFFQIEEKKGVERKLLIVYPLVLSPLWLLNADPYRMEELCGGGGVLFYILTQFLAFHFH